MDRRRELKEMYKNRPIVGGVYRIRNAHTGRALLLCTTDIRADENRHAFAVMTNTCLCKELREDWPKYGANNFVFEELERLEKSTEQTDKAFKEDLQALLALYKEQLDAAELY